MSLRWYQSPAIDNPSLWMAESGSYSLSAYKCGKRWGYTVWCNDVEIRRDWRCPTLKYAQSRAEQIVEKHKHG